MRRPRVWLLVLLMLALLVAAFLAAMQAVTLAWLSAFPERQAEFASLRIRFWIWALAAALLASADAWLVVRTARKINRQDRLSATKDA